MRQSLEELPAQLSPVPLLNESALKSTLSRVHAYHTTWGKTPAVQRAQCLENLGTLMTENYGRLLHLLIVEGKKTLPDAVAEVREAIDFCYYYAQQGRAMLGEPRILPGPTGEINKLYLSPRGTFACISPWNFPLAIFLGQVAAALVAGNTVMAKPASSTPAIASYVVELAHQAGIPQDALCLAHTSGSSFAEHILRDTRIAGVAFTGSTETARSINLLLATRPGPLAPFIAETGGLNAMIVDSSALPEQVVNDVIISGFQSAGQRCSALRILCLQQDVAQPIIHMIQGAMKELNIGDPALLKTDVGPVIDHNAKAGLLTYVEELRANPRATCLYTCDTPADTDIHAYVAPQLWQMESIQDITREAFGPIVHVVTFRSDQLSRLIDDINATGFGLTFGLHSRLESTIQEVFGRIHAGNVYINRSIIGAVVGVQPFGGEGLSGTGFKAGGPHYLLRFVTERTYTHDITAAGGNASLLAEI
jgi:RHH-type proline utilization regulon transcriptional repressor/proline dehydrogenase/delta 1-pyrroline-5-carboxylate dehydrogenase